MIEKCWIYMALWRRIPGVGILFFYENENVFEKFQKSREKCRKILYNQNNYGLFQEPQLMLWES